MGWFMDRSLWEGFISVLSRLSRDAHSRELRAEVPASNSHGSDLNSVCPPPAVRYWGAELSSVCTYSIARGKGRLLHGWVVVSLPDETGVVCLARS